jgi:hypothetical protein
MPQRVVSHDCMGLRVFGRSYGLNHGLRVRALENAGGTKFGRNRTREKVFGQKTAVSGPPEPPAASQ